MPPSRQCEVHPPTKCKRPQTSSSSAHPHPTLALYFSSVTPAPKGAAPFDGTTTQPPTAILTPSIRPHTSPIDAVACERRACAGSTHYCCFTDECSAATALRVGSLAVSASLACATILLLF